MAKYGLHDAVQQINFVINIYKTIDSHKNLKFLFSLGEKIRKYGSTGPAFALAIIVGAKNRLLP